MVFVSTTRKLPSGNVSENGMRVEVTERELIVRAYEYCFTKQLPLVLKDKLDQVLEGYINIFICQFWFMYLFLK